MERPHTGQLAISKFIHLWSIEFVCVSECVCAHKYLCSIHLFPIDASPHITAKMPNHQKSDYGLTWTGHTGIYW